jgi:hypothetical protein
MPLFVSRESNQVVEVGGMSTQALARAPESKDDGLKSSKPIRDDRNHSLSTNLRIWRQVLIAELLNLLEKRRYDAC